MRKNMKKALRETLQDLVDSGVKTTFTKKRMKELGVVLPEIKISSAKIRRIRKVNRLSQSVFAKLLNVSLSTVRHWEQGLREPTGATKVLLELLNRNPHALDFRIKRSKIAA